MTDYRIEPAKAGLSGTAFTPADKSISHRALLLAALAEGTSYIDGRGFGGDNISTVRALRALGVDIEELHETIVVHGVGLRGLRGPAADLDCGNSGTTMRLLLGILAVQAFSFRLRGDASLSKRPMRRVLDPLNARGALLRGTPAAGTDELWAPLASPGLPPGARLSGLRWDMPVASAQVKSALLLSGLYADGPTELTEPVTSRDHTERLLRGLDVPVVSKGTAVCFDPRRWSGVLPSFELTLPGDLSAAAFLLAAGVLVPNSHVTVERVGVNPTRTGVLDWMQNAKCGAERADEISEGGEPAATLTLAHSSGFAAPLGGELLVRAIDEVPAICAMATALPGVTVISGAAELRVKESDRLHATFKVLRAFGVSVEERAEGLAIEGKPEGTLTACSVDSFGDHRMAMMATVLSLRASAPCVVRNVDCVRTSFPGFAAALRSLGASVM